MPHQFTRWLTIVAFGRSVWGGPDALGLTLIPLKEEKAMLICPIVAGTRRVPD
jgi:hypothetical protein